MCTRGLNVHACISIENQIGWRNFLIERSKSGLKENKSDKNQNRNERLAPLAACDTGDGGECRPPQPSPQPSPAGGRGSHSGNTAEPALPGRRVRPLEPGRARRSLFVGTRGTGFAGPLGAPPGGIGIYTSHAVHE